MSNRKSTLSRRELFGRFTGRSRSEAAAEREPDRHPSALRADELLSSGEYQKAAELYARLTLRDPGFLEAFRRLGWCYLKQSMTGEARRVLEQLLDQKPDDATALLYVALSHAMDGSAENAVTVLREVHDYNRIVVQREVNLLQFLADSQELPEADDIVERLERVIAEQNQMPGTVGVYF
jgi:tetratricopeptide (TPR) repeat protein